MHQQNVQIVEMNLPVQKNGKQQKNFHEQQKKVAEKVNEKVTVNDKRVNVNVTENNNATENVTDTSQKTSQKIIDLIKEDPYISTTEMAEIIGVDRRNIVSFTSSLILHLCYIRQIKAD